MIHEQVQLLYEAGPVLVVCKPAGPDCTRCPLADWCVSNQSEALVAGRLPFGE